jgi:hypothetical protein
VTGGDRPTFTEVGGNNTTGIYVVGAGANNGTIPADTRLVGIIDCVTGAIPRYRYFDSKYSDRQEPALYSDVSILADGTNGLAAIKGSVYAGGTSVIAEVQSGTYGLSAIKTQTGTIATDTGLIKGYTFAGSESVIAAVQSATYGLSAIKTQTGTIATDTGLIKGYTFAGGESAIAALQSGTYGLSQIKTTATNAYNIVNNGTYGNSALNSTLTGAAARHTLC